MDRFDDTVDYTADSGQSPNRSVLHERALSLAADRSSDDAPEDAEDLVEFTLCGERYGISTACVREVNPVKSIAAVPCTPPFVAGLVSLRGEVVSVIDLRRLFGLTATGDGADGMIIILRNDTMEFGILADSVLGICSVPRSDIRVGEVVLADGCRKYIRGVTGQHLVVLDADALLNDSSLIINDSV